MPELCSPCREFQQGHRVDDFERHPCFKVGLGEPCVCGCDSPIARAGWKTLARNTFEPPTEEN